ncbi:substrate-binding domain-containing protein [Stenotrophomonas sp. AR026]|uniref:substrate-binding domain-containing protein n=1 Tax=Stenotrophomonas sp. AR026 TaxID=3398462 RepID=UPI003BAF3F97
MTKYKTLAALVATVLLATVGAASAQTVTGGGASLPADLYKGSADSILPANFSYAVTGSGTGKKAFLENNSALFSTTGTVHFAGSDSVLSSAELSTYTTNFNQPTNANRYGALIQVPSVATSVTIPFNKAGSAVDLSVTQICGVFSGAISDWSTIDTDRSGPIQVVYRPESSGTSEILTRFLATNCARERAETSNLVGGTFAIKSTFADLYKRDANGSLPGFLVAAPATGDTSLYNAVYAFEGRIGYAGPDVIPSLTDATKVAKVRGFSPDRAQWEFILTVFDPPSGIAAQNPANWAPYMGNPSVIYPIIGYTYLLIGQCYKDQTVANKLRGFLARHYSAAYPAAYEASITGHGFAPLPKMWRDAIRNRFVLASSTAGLNNPSTCSGIGRPL